MKILLVSPPTSFEQIYGDWDLSALDTYTPPLGILHLAGLARKHGHEVELLDLQPKDWSLEKAVRFVIERQPDLLGLTAMTINCLNADRIAVGVKKAGLRAPIVLGGSHITAVPVETMQRFESIDLGVVGEGEMTFLELVDSLTSGKEPAQVKGIVWRDAGGRINVNPGREMIADLDTLPLPAWDLLEGFPEAYPSSLLESKRLPSAGIMTSRGCPFSCTFCDNRVFGTRVRHHSAAYTLDMIGLLQSRFGIRDLMILDDNFLLDKDKLFSFCDALIAQKKPVSWYCMGHAKSMTRDRMEKIRQAGCWFIEIGIESGNDRILRNIRKNTTRDEIAQAVRNAKAAGLKVKGNFIFGFPDDTEDTLAETIRFAKDIAIDFFQQSYLTVWPGCRIADEVRSEASGESRDWGRLAHQRITFLPRGLTEEKLVSASKRAFREFYLRPRIIWSLLPRLASLRGIRFSFTAVVVFLRTIFRRN